MIRSNRPLTPVLYRPAVCETRVRPLFRHWASSQRLVGTISDRFRIRQMAPLTHRQTRSWQRVTEQSQVRENPDHDGAPPVWPASGTCAEHRPRKATKPRALTGTGMRWSTTPAGCAGVPNSGARNDMSAVFRIRYGPASDHGRGSKLKHQRPHWARIRASRSRPDPRRLRLPACESGHSPIRKSLTSLLDAQGRKRFATYLQAPAAHQACGVKGQPGAAAVPPRNRPHHTASRPDHGEFLYRRKRSTSRGPLTGVACRLQ